MAFDLAGKSLFMAIPRAQQDDAERFAAAVVTEPNEKVQARRLLLHWLTASRDPQGAIGGPSSWMSLALGEENFRVAIMSALVEKVDTDLMTAVLASLARGFAEDNASAKATLNCMFPALGDQWNEQAVSFVRQVTAQQS
ncbi:hypothetical protein ADILRU_0337 [Leifsonia rubra CMS 76R]|nr:hypothetical protein ADILRU_0337 [Leifsonia rubra CMS 76R]